ncbi:unnamed protein product [Adineta steineri]|uniref:G-protein coupled receptors family 1 profile domain-containing protein n=1 Tax=Adineta steineri TaxID=433720 RepID=A0A814TB21_9BILA|nr:unnamed protein product [Adineta steineri]CAF1150519.1 unnamed protein product [Adineta steineri]CAF1158406.1 unnamed protein product [Adineta steineri]
MSTITTLILVQQYITRYVLSTALILGSVGNFITIIIFSQKKHRINSCSIYLVAISIFGLMTANLGIAPLVYGLDHFNALNSSLALCRIRGYTIQVTAMCFRSTLILMCADRYALCSSRTSIRALCRPQIAYRSIGIVIIVWMIASFHLLIWESIENNICSIYGLYGQILSFYTLMFTGTIPILSMILINILIMKALRQLRTRIQPINNTRQIRQRDIQFMKLMMIEVIVFIICTTTHPLMFLYTNISNSIILNKTNERKQIETFLSFITMSVLLYMNYNTMFFVHSFTSKTYRMEVKEFILKIIRKSREIEPTQVD